MQLNKFIVYFNIFKIVGLGTFCLPLQQLSGRQKVPRNGLVKIKLFSFK